MTLAVALDDSAQSSFQWGDYLIQTNSHAAPVSCFRHVSHGFILRLLLRMHCFAGTAASHVDAISSWNQTGSDQSGLFAHCWWKQRLYLLVCQCHSNRGIFGIATLRRLWWWFIDGFLVQFIWSRCPLCRLVRREWHKTRSTSKYAAHSSFLIRRTRSPSSTGIAHRQTDWKTFLVNRLVGSKTLPDNFHEKVRYSINVESWLWPVLS